MRANFDEHECASPVVFWVTIGVHGLGTGPIMNLASIRSVLRHFDRELGEQFVDVCRAQDKPAAQVIREFMREYIGRHKRDVAKETADASARPTGRAIYDH